MHLRDWIEGVKGGGAKVVLIEREYVDVLLMLNKRPRRGLNLNLWDGITVNLTLKFPHYYVFLIISDNI